MSGCAARSRTLATSSGVLGYRVKRLTVVRGPNSYKVVSGAPVVSKKPKYRKNSVTSRPGEWKKSAKVWPSRCSIPSIIATTLSRCNP